MAKKVLSGVKTMATFATKGALVEGDGLTTLQPNTWYEINTVASTGSGLPTDKETAVFKTPDSTSSTTITPATGDSVFPLTLKMICKTDAEVSAEEGTIEVTDDCEEGYVANILDGFANITGSLNGFMKYDETTGEIVEGIEGVLGRFFAIVKDDADGNYVFNERENESLLLFMLLNKGAKVGQVQNWFIIPVLLNSLSTGAGLKDAQKRDIAWTKAQGFASQYQRTVGANDEIY